MANTFTCLTELEAVNQTLATVGEQPVTSLTSSGVSMVSLAQTFLHDASRSVQEVGLSFNSEDDYPLSPDSSSYFYVPNNTLKARPSDTTKQYLLRGLQLYDKENHTYVISETEVLVDIVFFLDFTLLPQAARKYITIKAARQFQARMFSSDIIHKLTEADEYEARTALSDFELTSNNYSIFDDPNVYNMVRRY